MSILTVFNGTNQNHYYHYPSNGVGPWTYIEIPPFSSVDITMPSQAAATAAVNATSTYDVKMHGGKRTYVIDGKIT